MKLALIEEEAVDGKVAEVERGQAGDGGVQWFEIETLFDSSQCEMRRKGAILMMDSESGGGRFRRGGQGVEAGSFDAAPENARRSGVREEAQVANIDGDGGTGSEGG